MTKQVTDHDLEFAEASLNAAAAVWRSAEQRVDEYAAELLRLQLRRLFADYPSLLKVSFESQYESDDEGGYFETIQVLGFADEDAEDADQAWDAANEIRPWDKASVGKVLSLPYWEGEDQFLTRAEVEAWDHNQQEGKR